MGPRAAVPRELILRLVSGPDQGRVIELHRGECVVIGREYTAESTIEVTAVKAMRPTGRMALPKDMVDRAENLLAHRERDPGTTAPQFPPSLDAYRRRDDIRVADQTVSRLHALIYLDEKGGGVIDLGSTNGTEVNGKNAAHGTVHNGDKVRLGDLEIAVEGL